MERISIDKTVNKTVYDTFIDRDIANFERIVRQRSNMQRNRHFFSFR